MNELELLKKEVQELRTIVNALVAPDKYILGKDIKINDGRDIIVAKGTGTRIGTEATQKLSFWGVTPVIQQDTVGTTLDMTLVGGTAVTESNGFGGGLGGKYYTIGDIVRALKKVGILKV